jgi:hypothetical protein
MFFLGSALTDGVAKKAAPIANAAISLIESILN